MNCFLEGRDANTARPSWLVEENATEISGSVEVGGGRRWESLPAALA